MKRRAKEKDRLVSLDRVLSKYGLASRTDAVVWIKAGRVTVNGKRVNRPESWVNIRTDVVRLDGLRLRKKRPVYLALNKPKGLITTMADERARRTVYECLRDVKQWVFPVGRLDKNTSGLLLLTNDTQFAHRLTDPASKVPKTYLVKTRWKRLITPYSSWFAYVLPIYPLAICRSAAIAPLHRPRSKRSCARAFSISGGRRHRRAAACRGLSKIPVR